MRRFRRILVNATTVASLVLCVRTHWVADSWAQSTSEVITVNGGGSHRGSPAIFCGNPRFLVNAGATFTRWVHARGPAGRRRRRRG